MMVYTKDSEQKLALDSSSDESELSHQTGQPELRCQVCHALVPGALCGRKSPCPACGYPYPLGDCSDLAEN